MQEHIDQFISPLRAAAWTYGAIGIFAWFSRRVGLAGMTAYSVTQRRHEIAVRIALGAPQSRCSEPDSETGSFLDAGWHANRDPFAWAAEQCANGKTIGRKIAR